MLLSNYLWWSKKSGQHESYTETVHKKSFGRGLQGMSLLSGVSGFFGLDIGTAAVRLVELRGAGPTRALAKYAYVPVDARLIMSDSKSDQQKIMQTIGELLAQSRMTTRNVAVGIPSAHVFTT